MENFLRRVLPDGGKYVVVSIADESGAREIRGLPDLASVVDAAQKLSMHPTNVYFAVGTYDHDRKSPRAKRALLLIWTLSRSVVSSVQSLIFPLSARRLRFQVLVSLSIVAVGSMLIGASIGTWIMQPGERSQINSKPSVLSWPSVPTQPLPQTWHASCGCQEPSTKSPTPHAVS